MPNWIGQISPDETRVCRYIDFTGLVALLEHRCLHFSRLEAFNDKHEGFLNCLTDDDHYDVSDAGNLVRISSHQLDDRSRKNSAEFKHFVSPLSAAIVKATGVHCWRVDCGESHAMWKVFGRTDFSVAIKSTVGSLLRSLQLSEYIMFIGNVQYIDYANTKVPMSNMMNAIFHKSAYFAEERELRLACNKVIDRAAPHFLANSYVPMPLDGVDVPVRLDILIDEIVVSPYAADWFVRLVEAVVRRYGLTASVVPSIIALRK
jgi:hypothetical protein